MQIPPQSDTRNLVDAYKGMPTEDVKRQLSSTAFPLHIAIENLQHDINIGSIVRSANAFNVSSVHIVGKRHWNKRGAMGTDKYLSVIYHKNIAEFETWVKAHKLPLIGVDNIDGSVNIHTYAMPSPCMLVFGQEGPGLSPDMQALCQAIVEIPQYGSTRSINVAAAAAIAMYEWVLTHQLRKSSLNPSDS